MVFEYASDQPSDELWSRHCSSGTPSHRKYTDYRVILRAHPTPLARFLLRTSSLIYVSIFVRVQLKQR